MTFAVCAAPKGGVDLVAWIFGGSGSLLARIVYTLVGLAAVWCISLLFRDDAAAQTKPQSQ